MSSSTDTAGPRDAAVRESMDRVLRSTRDLTAAQYTLAVEWFQLPLWFTGAGSAERFQRSYMRVVEAGNELLSAYAEAAAPFRATLAGTARQTGEATRAAADAQIQSVAAVARTAGAAQDAAAAGALRAVRRNADATARIVHEASKVAGEAIERAERAQAQPIKGHLAEDGEKIYHLPGQSSYERTEATEQFATEEEAQAAGYRRALSPGAGQVKGKIARDGSKIYHLPGQANYDRFEADALFETEADAQAAGYRASQR